MQTFEDHLWTLLCYMQDPCFNHEYFLCTDPFFVLTLQNCNFHSCCRFRDFCVCLSLLLCLGITVWLRMLHKGWKQEAMELNRCEGLEIAKQCKILLIKLLHCWSKNVLSILVLFSLQFLSELCSAYWAADALTISPLTLHQLLQFALKPIPWLWTA